MSKFNPNDNLIDLQGKKYLEIKWRLVWLRELHGDKASVVTELIHANDSIIVFKATIAINGEVVATAHGSAPAQGKGSWRGREIEKAETASVGRALAHAGFGTQFAGEDVEEGEGRLSDSPVDLSKSEKPKSPFKGAGKKEVPPTDEVPSVLLWRTDTPTKDTFAHDHPHYRSWLKWAFDEGIIDANVTVTQLKEIIKQHHDNIQLGGE